MKRRLPPRHKSGPKKGQFMSKRARAARSAPKRRKTRRNPGRAVMRASSNQPKRKASVRRRAPSTRRPVARKRRAYRANPRRPMGIVQTFSDGLVEAGQILIGKAAARSIPALANLPKQGNVGLAVQAGTALVIGYVAEMFLSKSAARAMTAGALTAPLETLIVSYEVPWLSQALAPVTAQANMSSYVSGGSLGAYVRRPRLEAGSSERGLGRYATERGMDYGYGS